jgi:hypothetical protein
MRHTFLMGADSPGFQGRGLCAVTAEEDDLDLEGLDLSGGTDKKDKDDTGTEHTDDETPEGDIEGLSEDAAKRVERYKQKAKDRDEIATERNQLLKEVGRLRAVEDAREAALKAATQITPDEAAEKLADEIFNEATKITSDDQDVRTKGVYKIIAKKLLDLQKAATQTAVQVVEGRQAQQQAASQQQTAAEKDAIDNAKIALEEVGLDPEKTYPLFERVVNALIADKPKWFDVVPPGEQYIRIANRVLKMTNKTTEDNAAHQREAGGQLDRGGRGPRSSPKGGKDDAPETMADGMRALRKNQVAKSSALYTIASHRG